MALISLMPSSPFFMISSSPHSLSTPTSFLQHPCLISHRQILTATLRHGHSDYTHNMSDRKQEAAYAPKGPIVEEVLIVSIRLSTTATGEQRFKFYSELGPFAVVADVSTGKFAFKVDTNRVRLHDLQPVQAMFHPVKGDTSFTTSLLYRCFGE